MLTRREMLVLTGAGTAWAAAALSGRGARAAIAAQTPVNFDVPSGACDCHAHIFPDPARYPFTPNRVYTPSGATVEDLLELQRALHLDRVILNQPSVYGTDNSALLDGIRQLGPQRARGVVIVDEKATNAQLDDLDKAGVRGVHVNLAVGGAVDPATSARRLQDAAQRVAGRRGWNVQTQTQLAIIEVLKDQLMNMPVPLVIVHFGGATAEKGVEHARLCRAGRAGARRQGLCEGLGRPPHFQARPRFPRRRAARPGAHPGEPGARPVGDELASSQLLRSAPGPGGLPEPSDR